jgi:thiamine monophosphate kinase
LVYSVSWLVDQLHQPPDTIKLAAAGLKEGTVPVSAIAADYANPLGALAEQRRAKWKRFKG